MKLYPPPSKLSNHLLALLKLTLLFLLLALPFSCNLSSDIQPQESVNTSLTIDEAKRWYEKNQKGSRISGQDKKVIWEDAVEKKGEDGQDLVVVPIVSLEKQSGFSITTDEKGNKKKEGDTFISADLKTSFVFSKVKDEIEMMQMQLLFDENSDPKKRKNKVKANDFDGYLFLYDNDEKFVSGAQFKNGKVERTLGTGKKNGRTSYMELTVCVDFYQKVTLEDGTVLSSWTVIRTECHTSYTNDGTGSTTFYSNALEGSTGGGGGSSSLGELLNLDYINNLWDQLNNTEKDYFRSNWWLLPGAASAYWDAMSAVNYLYCNDNDDGNWNAFKHAFWAAMLCDHINPSQALMISDNHEAYPDDYNSYDGEERSAFEMRKEMDEHNNQLGINTYKAMRHTLYPYSYGYRLTQIQSAIINKINTGYGQRIITDSNNKPLSSISTTNGDRCR